MKNELVKLCVDTVNNRVQNYSKFEADEVIRKAFFEMNIAKESRIAKLKQDKLKFITCSSPLKAFNEIYKK